MVNKEIVKKNYDRGLWSIEMLNSLVGKNKLTAGEFEEITGQPYGGTVHSVATAELDAAYKEGVNAV